ncbi:MAG: alpha/beta hydrolase [Candidatus Omnitrophica bacterium]|nr:alpha/beta hydrolase [Candidatus Omnitrophota bacterium]
MKKLIIIFFASLFFMFALFVIAFLYVAFIGSEVYEYGEYSGERLSAKVQIEKYTTENNIIYKTIENYPDSLDFPVREEELFLNRHQRMPVKYVAKFFGTRNEEGYYILKQEGETADILFYSHPLFSMLNKFSTGVKTFVFSPDKVATYMALFDKYSYWRRGTQFFEVMMPVNGVLPIFRDKMSVKYFGDEFIPVNGKRVETEKYIVSCPAFKDISVNVSKYTHIILHVDAPGINARYSIVSFHRRFEKLFKMLLIFYENFEPDLLFTEKIPGPVQIDKLYPIGREKTVFFEGEGNIILSGRLFLPVSGSRFPVMIIVSDSIPRPQSEEFFYKNFISSMNRKGIAVFDFDMPGQGKSQGSYNALGDIEKSNHIKAAYNFMRRLPLFNKDKIVFLGLRSGGYLALSASTNIEGGVPTVVLGLPFISQIDLLKGGFKQGDLAKYLSSFGFKQFDAKYMMYLCTNVENQFQNILGSSDSFFFFANKKIFTQPLKDFMNRRPYETLINSKGALLLLFGKDDEDFRIEVADKLKLLGKGNNKFKVFEYRSLGKFLGRDSADPDKPGFVIDEDLIKLVDNWVEKLGT